MRYLHRGFEFEVDIHHRWIPPRNDTETQGNPTEDIALCGGFAGSDVLCDYVHLYKFKTGTMRRSVSIGVLEFGKDESGSTQGWDHSKTMPWSSYRRAKCIRFCKVSFVTFPISYAEWILSAFRPVVFFQKKAPQWFTHQDQIKVQWLVLGGLNIVWFRFYSIPNLFMLWGCTWPWGRQRTLSWP